SIDEPLVAFLQKLRDVWRLSLVYVPHLPSSEDIEITLQRILAMTPTSVSYVGRPSQRLALLSPSPGPSAPASGSEASKDRVQTLGLPWTPQHIKMAFASYTNAIHLTGPLVALPEGQTDEEKAAKAEDYLHLLFHRLVTTPYAQMKNEQGELPKPTL